MSERLETSYDVKRNELSSQINLLLTQSPSIAALLTARDILKDSTTKFMVLNEITPHICSFLSFQDLLSWCRVCRETRKWRGHVMRNQITTLLQRFIPAPHDLLNEMRQTDSVISGSSIVWLLDGFPESWSPGDLDVYCPPGEGPRLIEFFQNQGYSIMDPSDEDKSSFFKNAKLSSATAMKKGDLKVDILETETDSTLQSVMWYHSTVVMNYISWNEIAVLYPSLTLRKLAIVQDQTKQRGFAWLKKYKERSYVIYYPSEVPDGILDYCPAIVRSNRDRHSLLIPFGNQEPTSSQLLESWVFMGVTRGHEQCEPHRCFFLYSPQAPTDIRIWLAEYYRRQQRNLFLS